MTRFYSYLMLYTDDRVADLYVSCKTIQTVTVNFIDELTTYVMVLVVSWRGQGIDWQTHLHGKMG